MGRLYSRRAFTASYKRGNAVGNPPLSFAQMLAERVVLARVALACLLWRCGGLAAQRLPVKTYGTADGLPSSYVTSIVEDAHGFLWFCTRGGLARFDGATFASWGTHDGPPLPAGDPLPPPKDGPHL